MVSLIVAVSRNGVIGADNKLLWHLPADLKRFKALTLGHHIVMGRKTFESIGRILPGRTTVVITRNPDRVPAGCLAAGSLAEALALCTGDTEPFITGGGEIYRQALPVADRIYLTRVHADFEGDTGFPDPDPSAWSAVSEEHHPADDRNPWAFSFVTYERAKGKEG